MTEHESEQLYHDLRRKLEGYGSAPPESVWAGIREQVPARPKRNWRPLVLLLLLCFTVGSVLTGRYYWPAATSASGTAAAPEAAATPSPTAALRNQPGSASSSSYPTTDYANTAVGSAGSAEVPMASGTAPAAAGHAPATYPPGLTARRPHLLPALTPRTKRDRVATVTGRTAEAASSPVARTTRRRRVVAGLAAVVIRRHRTVTGSHGEVARTAAGRSGYPRAGRLARTDVPRAYAPDGASSTMTAPGGKASSGRALKISNEPLNLLAVRPQPLEVEEPEVRRQRRARKQPSRRELRLRNWSGQVLLGQNLTYRLMGGAPTQLEQLERPGTGFSGQLSGTYAFSRQLALSGGLGYSEYANSLHYQLKKTSSETMRQIDFRDVYRFITIPVQAQLTMGGNQRWRYGLLGGGTLALLTSARTTVGSACNCGQREWTSDMPDSTFSRTNLALTAGAFASYQFAPGQWLTFRPQGQVFLNSLTAPSSRAPRRPWGLGIQVGYSWDLDPRKR